MPFTRTVNYVQNTPTSINWASYLNTSPSRNVTVVFDVPLSFGTISVPETSGVIVMGSTITDSNGWSSQQTRVYGPVASVNTALNGATWNPQTGAASDTGLTTADGPNRGGTGLQIQINPAITHGLSVGNTCKVGGVLFRVGKIDSSNSPTRFWLAGPSFSFPTLGTFLQTSGGSNIAPIIDCSTGNIQGTYTINCSVIDGSTEVNTYTFAGSPFIAEPTFSSAPASSMTISINTWTTGLNFGQISQANSNYESVQICMKAYENDPQYLGVTDYTLLSGYPSGGTDEAKLLFIGNAIAAKAALGLGSYISNTNYGYFSNVLIGKRASATGGVTIWNLTDIPTNCNYALQNVSFYRTADVDFKFEVRIVDGQTRIYSGRGL